MIHVIKSLKMEGFRPGTNFASLPLILRRGISVAIAESFKIPSYIRVDAQKRFPSRQSDSMTGCIHWFVGRSGPVRNVFLAR